jgi:hypothetical protein
MNSPCHVYVDLDIINNDSTTDDEPPVLKFEEIRNTPFIDDTSNYFCSIIRFSLQTGDSLPVFIPRVQIGQTDPNMTVYKMTLVYRIAQGGGSYASFETTLPVNYISNNASPVPRQPLTQQDLSIILLFHAIVSGFC